MESAWVCKGRTNVNQTCIFRNVYLGMYGRVFPTINIVGPRKQLPRIHVASWGGERIGGAGATKVGVKAWDSRADLERAMNDTPIVRIKGLTLSIRARFHYNWAHSTFDALYPGFVGACKFHRHRDPFLLMLDSHDYDPDVPCDSGCQSSKNKPLSPYSRDDVCRLFEAHTQVCRMRDAFRLFASLGDPQGEYIRLLPMIRSRRVWLFDELIMGSQSHGQKLSGRELSMSLATGFLPGNRGVMPLFRQRMYWSHGLNPAVRHSSMQTRALPLRAYIADNKRFAKAGDNATRLRLMELEKLYPSDCPHVHVQFIDWSRYKTWPLQMKLLYTIDIFMTSIGTAQYYHMYLQDGAVTAHLGHLDEAMRELPSYGEENLLASNARARVVYLPLDVMRRGATTADYADLLEEAVNLIRSDFAVPTPHPHKHLSILLQMTEELAARDPYWEASTNPYELFAKEFEVVNPDTGVTYQLKEALKCPRKYPSYLLYEVPRVKAFCKINGDILRAVKRDFKLDALLDISPSSCDCVVCVDCPGQYHRPSAPPARSLHQCSGRKSSGLQDHRLA
eukprot:4569408-Amphidinium_carterae.1